MGGCHFGRLELDGEKNENMPIFGTQWGWVIVDLFVELITEHILF